MADRSIFTINFSNIAVTAAQDLLSMTAPTGYRLELISARFGQLTDVGDAAAENLAVTVTRGAAVGSGGAAVTPVPVFAKGRIALATARRNDTTAMAGTVVFTDVVNIAAPYLFCPFPEERPTAEPGQVLAIALTAPADSLTMYGSATFAEVAI